MRPKVDLKETGSELGRKKRKREWDFRFGNYNRYYGYRLGKTLTEDPRLKCFQREWFEGKDCLDVGCNEGFIPIAIAQKYMCRSILGVDIDRDLVSKAISNLRKAAEGLEDGLPEDGCLKEAGAFIYCVDSSHDQRDANQGTPDAKYLSERLEDRLQEGPMLVEAAVGNHLTEDAGVKGHEGGLLDDGCFNEAGALVSYGDLRCDQRDGSKGIPKTDCSSERLEDGTKEGAVLVENEVGNLEKETAPVSGLENGLPSSLKKPGALTFCGDAGCDQRDGNQCIHKLNHLVHSLEDGIREGPVLVEQVISNLQEEAVGVDALEDGLVVGGCRKENAALPSQGDFGCDQKNRPQGALKLNYSLEGFEDRPQERRVLVEEAVCNLQKEGVGVQDLENGQLEEGYLKECGSLTAFGDSGCSDRDGNHGMPELNCSLALLKDEVEEGPVLREEVVCTLQMEAVGVKAFEDVLLGGGFLQKTVTSTSHGYLGCDKRDSIQGTLKWNHSLKRLEDGLQDPGLSEDARAFIPCGNVGCNESDGSQSALEIEHVLEGGEDRLVRESCLSDTTASTTCLGNACSQREGVNGAVQIDERTVRLSPVDLLQRVKFRTENIIENFPSGDFMKDGMFDTVLCLSVTKWIHLNWGDKGLIRLFAKIYHILRPGGILILEPQPWKSYHRKQRMSEVTKRHFKEIRILPTDFKEVLLDKAEAAVVIVFHREKRPEPCFLHYWVQVRCRNQWSSAKQQLGI